MERKWQCRKKRVQKKARKSRTLWGEERVYLSDFHGIFSHSYLVDLVKISHYFVFPIIATEIFPPSICIKLMVMTCVLRVHPNFVVRNHEQLRGRRSCLRILIVARTLPSKITFLQTENFPQDLLRRNLLNFNDLLVEQKFWGKFFSKLFLPQLARNLKLKISCGRRNEMRRFSFFET